MKKVILALFVIATALAFSPAASAQTWDFTFTSGSLVATGTLTGTLAAPGEYDLTSGTINLSGSAINGTGILVPIENNLFYTGGGTELFNFPSPAGGSNWASGFEDAVLFPSQDPQLNAQWGALTFAIGGYNTTTGTGSGAGLAIWSNGPGDYGAFGGNWAVNIGGGASFTATLVPEGGAALLYLLLAGMACFGAMRLSSRNQHGIRMA